MEWNSINLSGNSRINKWNLFVIEWSGLVELNGMEHQAAPLRGKPISNSSKAKENEICFAEDCWMVVLLFSFLLAGYGPEAPLPHQHSIPLIK